MPEPATEPLAYFNGRMIPADQLQISVTDPGFVMGVAVSEQLRTFQQRLFRPDDHFLRLQRSLNLIDLPAVDTEAMKTSAIRLVQHNAQQLLPGDDLGLTIFVTPGEKPSHPTVGMFTRPLPFGRWDTKYADGDHLVVSSVRQIPSNCWPAELKCRSRMHYYLADQDARRTRPDARAILLDQEGLVAEASTASLLIYRHEEGLVAPPTHKVLPGISVRMLKELALDLSIPLIHRDIRPEELWTADEVLLSSTSPCVWPVATIDNQSLPLAPMPDRISTRLLNAWSAAVGVDIVQQAEQFAHR